MKKTYKVKTNVLSGFDTVKKFKRRVMGINRWPVTRTLDQLAQTFIDLNLASTPNEAEKLVKEMSGGYFPYTRNGSALFVSEIPKQFKPKYKLWACNPYAEAGGIF